MPSRTLHTVCISILLFAAIAVTTAQNAAFGRITKNNSWVITTGAGLTITMNSSTCDITSLLFHGRELQYDQKYTHINSGLGFVSNATIEDFVEGKPTTRITCKITGLTQYYFIRANENNIYMGTYHTANLILPELRFLGRFAHDTMGIGPTQCIIAGGTIIEGQDIFMVGNETRSKYYSGIPFIDDKWHNVWGPGGAVYVAMSPLAYETSLGGPFFRDININVKDDCTELTFYMNSGHTNTEQTRYGFHGPYALAFTGGEEPTNLDYSFLQQQTMEGFMSDFERGSVSGTIIDRKRILANQNRTVVHFFNRQAQYWTTATDGIFTSPKMKPGMYTAVVYKKELEVGSTTVIVTKGSNTTSNITVTYDERDAIWRIGDWDGTPEGFLNADKIQRMHPSDYRMAPRVPMNFTIGVNTTAEFPLAQFRSINNPIIIHFTLSEGQIASNHTFRAGVTVEYLDARLNVTVNNEKPQVPQNTLCVEGEINHCVDSRSITRGVTHGNNVVYEYPIPAGALKVGDNTIQMEITSLTESKPFPFTQPALAFDAFELV